MRSVCDLLMAPSPPARLARLALATITCCLALASPAYADFYVTPTGSGISCTLGTPCGTVQNGVNAAETAGGAQTVHVAAGSYTGEVFINAGNVSIVGAGPATTTLAANPTDANALDVFAVPASVRDMSLTVPSGQDGTTVSVVGLSGSPSLALSNVNITNHGTKSSDDGLFVGVNANATVARSFLSIDGPNSSGIHVQGTIRVGDSTVQSTNGTSPLSAPIFADRGMLQVDRTSINQQGPGAAVSLQTQGSASSVFAILDDDVIVGGSVSIQTAEGSSDSTLYLYNDTILPGAANDPVLSDGDVTGNLHATLDSNILLGTLPTDNHISAITCSYNNLPPGVSPGTNYSCDHTTNFNNDELYPGGIPSNYALPQGSLAIDAGDPAALNLFESTTDLLGNPRVQGSNGACVGTFRRDLGATEYQGGAGQPLTISLDGPSTGTTGSPLAFTATPLSLVTFAWTFGDGGTASTPNGASHTYTAAGDYTVSVTETDAGGCTGTASKVVHVTAPTTGGGGTGGGTGGGGGGGGGGGSGTPDTTPPTLSVHLAKTKVAARSNDQLVFTLSEPASITGTITRRQCHKSKKTHKRSCKTVKKGTFATIGGLGSGSASLTTKRLHAGRYTLTLVATDASGNVSPPVKLTFTVKAKGKRKR